MCVCMFLMYCRETVLEKGKRKPELLTFEKVFFFHAQTSWPESLAAYGIMARA